MAALTVQVKGAQCLCTSCPTLPPPSACAHRPEYQQRDPCPHTPPQGRGGFPEGTPTPSGSRWAPPQRSEPPQEHPDQYLTGRKKEQKKKKQQSGQGLMSDIIRLHYQRDRLHPEWRSLLKAVMIMHRSLGFDQTRMNKGRVTADKRSKVNKGIIY